MLWEEEVGNFITSIYNKGVYWGRREEHDIKKKTCKYYAHRGAAMGVDGCKKLRAVCRLEDCPSCKEEVVSVRN